MHKNVAVKCLNSCENYGRGMIYAEDDIRHLQEKLAAFEESVQKLITSKKKWWLPSFLQTSKETLYQRHLQRAKDLKKALGTTLGVPNTEHQKGQAQQLPTNSDPKQALETLNHKWDELENVLRMHIKAEKSQQKELEAIVPTLVHEVWTAIDAAVVSPGRVK